MAKKKTALGSDGLGNVEDYRHKGAKRKNNPPAKIAAEGESLETSYELWKDIYNTVADKDVHRNAGEHLLMLQAQLDLREINRLADQFAKETGKRPKYMSELVDAGLLSRQPLDPMHFPYVIGEDGKADLYPKSPLKEELEREKMQTRAFKH